MSTPCSYLESNAAAATESTDLPPSLLNSLPLTLAEGARRMMGVAAPLPLLWEAVAWLYPLYLGVVM